MIYIPNICGTCKGATKSLGIVYEVYEKELIKEKPKKIYIYKEILHNSKVISEFENLGIEIIDNLDKVTSDDIVIIRAHGEKKDIYDYLNNHNIEYYDATCPNVIKIHNCVKEKYDEGYEIIIIGKKDHPEVIGTNGWCNNSAIIITGEEDLNKISNNQKKYIISQTTFNKDRFEDLVSKIKLLFDSSEIVVNNSICNAVERICKSSEDVAKKCDIMFVIGGKNSSNTEEIFKNVSSHTESYKLENIEELFEFVFKNDITEKENIGITGGASTPLKEIYNCKYLLSFVMFYQKRLKELTLSQHNINNKLIKEDDNEIVKDIVNDFIDLNKDGKYIRGVLIALGKYVASNVDNSDYLNLAYAYEMFQTSILVHDDIIDNAKLRRGKMTIPRRICHKYLNLKNDKTYQDDTLKLANSVGICVGDFGFYEANNLIINSYKNNENLAELLDCYNDIVIKTIKGEILDVTLPFYGKYNYRNIYEKDILDIYHLKTSWYTIIGPFMLGSILGGKKIENNLIEVLDELGVCFQLKDDILGIFSESNVIGKSNFSDIEEFKQTILYWHIINTKYKDEFLRIYGKKNILEKDLIKIRELLIESGSYDYAINILDDLSLDIVNKIDELDIINEAKDILKGLFLYINMREK